MAKKSAVAKKVVNEDNVVFQFTNGQELVCRLADAPEPMRDRLAVAGVAHTVGDTYAGADGDASWAYDQAKDRWDRICAGEWARRGGGATGPRIDKDAMVEALFRVMDRAGKPQTMEACREVIDGQSPESLKALHKGRLAADYLEIMAERAKARAADTDDDLADLFQAD